MLLRKATQRIIVRFHIPKVPAKSLLRAASALEHAGGTAVGLEFLGKAVHIHFPVAFALVVVVLVLAYIGGEE